MALYEYAGVPLAEDLNSAIDFPHTLSYAVIYRARINSFGELPKDKRPPRNLWDKPQRLTEFLDHVWDKDAKRKDKNYIDIDLEEVE